MVKKKKSNPSKAELLLEKFPNMSHRAEHLEDKACPECGNRAALRIKVVTWMEFTDEGAGESEDAEFGNTSPMECPECLHYGIVKSFHFPGLDELILKNTA